MIPTYFEVQHLTLADGWVNTWSDNDGKPVRFRRRNSAIVELRRYLGDLAEDVRKSEILPYHESEFRVAKI